VGLEKQILVYGRYMLHLRHHIVSEGGVRDGSNQHTNRKLWTNFSNESVHKLLASFRRKMLGPIIHGLLCILAHE